MVWSDIIWHAGPSGLTNKWDVGLSNDDLLQDFDLSNCGHLLRPGRLRGHRSGRGHLVVGSQLEKSVDSRGRCRWNKTVE